VFRFNTVAFAIGSLSFCDNTVPDTVLSCADEARVIIMRGTIVRDRKYLGISRSLENEDKEKLNCKSIISGT
jgi:hypothetical protein